MGKVPLKLDWDELFSSKDNEAWIAEVEVVQSSADQALVAHLSDRQIQEKILRNSATLSSNLRDKFLDKGTKLRSNIQQFQAELDRRKLAKARKDAEIGEGSRQFESTGSPGLSPYKSTNTQQPQSASLFSKKLEERADKCEISRKDGRQLHEKLNQEKDNQLVPIICRYDGKLVMNGSTPDYEGGQVDLVGLARTSTYDELKRAVCEVMTINPLEYHLVLTCKWPTTDGHVAVEVSSDRKTSLLLDMFYSNPRSVELFVEKDMLPPRSMA